MEININLLPKKINDINYFKKTEKGCEIYSYSKNVFDRNEVVIIELDGFEIKKDFCVNNKALEMVKVLYPADITVTDSSFIIKSKKGKFTAKLMDDTLFNIDIDDDSNFINTDIDVLLKATFYTCKNDKKAVLKGVRLDTNGNVYATDSFRAYLYKQNDLSKDGLVLPISFIRNVKELNGDNDSNIQIIYKDNTAMYQKDNIKILTRLLDGNYPDMNGIFARKDQAQVVEINDEEITEKISIASNVGLDMEEKTIVALLSYNNLEVLGDNNYTSEIKFENEDKFKMKVSLEYLDQGLKIIGSGLRFSVLCDKEGKNGKMIFLEKGKELVLVLGIIGA